jgi:hypothetical protein
MDRGVMPADNVAAGMTTPNLITGKYVNTVTVGGAADIGTVTITYADAPPLFTANNKINGASLVMTANGAGGGSVVWSCTAQPGILGANPKWLPSACR